MTKPQLSRRAHHFRQNMSPVKQIMMYADPATFRELGLNPADVVSFAGGWVNHQAPEGLQRAYLSIVQDAVQLHKSGGYSPTLGMPECKAALAAYEHYMYGIQLHNEHIAIGQSSTQMTYDLMSVLMNPGDKILLLDPSYCNFPTQITTALDVDVLRFPVVDVASWRYIADEKIEEFVTFVAKEKPKVILLVSPDNRYCNATPGFLCGARRIG